MRIGTVCISVHESSHYIEGIGPDCRAILHQTYRHKGQVHVQHINFPIISLIPGVSFLPFTSLFMLTFLLKCSVVGIAKTADVSGG